MELVTTSCCAIKEIESLSDHRSPEEAMIRLCQELEEDVSDRYDDDDDRRAILLIPGLINFSAVVGYEKGNSRTAPTYGQDFHAFILKHNLGEVVKSPLTTNRINHPGRKIRAWMWRPNVKNLRAWWAARPESKSYH